MEESIIDTGRGGEHKKFVHLAITIQDREESEYSQRKSSVKVDVGAWPANNPSYSGGRSRRIA